MVASRGGMEPLRPKKPPEVWRSGGVVIVFEDDRNANAGANAGPLALRSASSHAGGGEGLGIEGDDRVKLRLVGVDPSEAQLDELFGGQGARVKGGIDVFDGRRFEVELSGAKSGERGGEEKGKQGR